MNIDKYLGAPDVELGEIEPFVIKDITMTGKEWINAINKTVEYIKRKNG